MTDDRSLDERVRIEDQLDQVGRDLVEVDEQEASGELDITAADGLRATYRSERRRLEDRLEELADATGDADVPRRDRRRLLAGIALMLAGFIAVTVVLLGTVRQREPGELITGGIAGGVASGDIDLSEVTNEEMEAVVAANPDVVGMRLALARRYFEVGEFDSALPHFMTILEEQDPDNAEALASVGWMTHLSGRPDVGVSFVERAVSLVPDYPQAYWFLASIRFHGLDDPEGAIEPLERLLSFDAVPDEIRIEAEALLETARTGS